MNGHPEQTPFFDTAMEDFPVAMLRGGKGLPAKGGEAAETRTETEEKHETVEEKTEIHQTAGDNAIQFGQVDGNVIIQK